MSYNIYANIRKDKKNSKGFVPIYLYVFNGSTLIKKESLKQSVHIDLWDEDLRRVHKKHPLATLINSLIDKEVSDLNTKILAEKIVKGSVDIQELLTREKGKEVSFFDFAKRQIKEKDYAFETRRSYGLYLGKIEAYRSTLKLTDINFEFLQGYESYLRNQLKNEHNTVSGNLKFISVIINDALKMKYLQANPFKDYHRPRFKQTKRTFLTAEEIALFEKFADETSDDLLKTAANFFLFMTFTGLRFSDAIRFKSSFHIVDGKRIVMETQKTKQTANLYINNKVNRYITAITESPLTVAPQTFNRQLKFIAAYTGIKKKVTAHVARHSFGAALATSGVPEKVAQGLLAHGDPASTKIYFHLDAPALDEAMRRFNDK